MNLGPSIPVSRRVESAGRNNRAGNVVDFLRRLRRKIRVPLITAWGRWNVHRSGESRIERRARKRIEFQRLPAYAPELNPVEAMRNHAKYTKLANYVPDDADELDADVRASLSDTSRNNQLKRSSFKTARLRI